jgi:hypothetical protein
MTNAQLVSCHRSLGTPKPLRDFWEFQAFLWWLSCGISGVRWDDDPSSVSHRVELSSATATASDMAEIHTVHLCNPVEAHRTLSNREQTHGNISWSHFAKSNLTQEPSLKPETKVEFRMHRDVLIDPVVLLQFVFCRDCKEAYHEGDCDSLLEPSGATSQVSDSLILLSDGLVPRKQQLPQQVTGSYLHQESLRAETLQLSEPRPSSRLSPLTGNLVAFPRRVYPWSLIAFLLGEYGIGVRHTSVIRDNWTVSKSEKSVLPLLLFHYLMPLLQVCPTCDL